MISRRIFFSILSIAFWALFAVIVVSTSLRLAGRSWELFVCTGQDCPSSLSVGPVRHGVPKILEPAQKSQHHSV